MNENQEVFTPEQAAEYLQVSRETIYRYIREGKLIASKLGRAYRVPKHSLELLLWESRTCEDVSLSEYLGERGANGIQAHNGHPLEQETPTEGKEMDVVDFLISTIGMLESEETDLSDNVEEYVAEALTRKYS